MLPARRAQVWRHRRAFQRPRHFHEEPELNLIAHGSAAFGVGDRTLRVGAGEVLLFHPGQDHVLLEASADLRLFAVALRPELAARAGATLSRARSHGCRLSERETARAVELFSSADNGSSATSLEEPLSELFRVAEARSATNHVLSRRALQRLYDDPEARACALGAELGVDASALSRHFHLDLGLRFVEYRARIRLLTFVRLADAGLALSRAALDSGFGSYAQCHRVFVEALGCSPRSYFVGERRALDDARTVDR